MKYISHLALAALIVSCTGAGTAGQSKKKKNHPRSHKYKTVTVIQSVAACSEMDAGLISDEKALSKPAPEYPEEARAKNISGAVMVGIEIDKSGNVISARAVSGPPLLLKAAVDAAYKARFPVTKLSGVPVAVMGKIKYDFVL